MPESKTPRIIIVDDELRNMQALCDTLPVYGFETFGCCSGEEALDALRTQSFDLMLTDLMMPGIDGIGLIDLARQIDPSLAAVLMTGEGTIATAVAAMRAGAHDYVLKPFKASVAVPVLTRSLEVRRLRMEVNELQQREMDALRQAKVAAEQGSRAKGEFLSRMSHELRTPLNSILGFAQLLEMRYDDPQILEAARFITKGGQHLLQLINEVLDLARIESGRMTMSIESVGAADVLNQAARLVQPLADAAGIDVLIDQPKESSNVSADRQRLLQVLINLLSNAIKYNRPSGTVRLRCSQGSGQRLRFEVADDGCGIGLEDREKLFQPFQRLGDQNVEGTGLGLALSERFARQMNGELLLLDSSPQGSTFCIELNAAEDRIHELTAREDSPSLRLPFHNLNGTVLYVEDNLSNIRLLEVLFAKSDKLKLIPITHGRMGLEFAQQHKPDLILLDMHLPDLSGAEVLLKLKSDPATQSIPVTILSADADPASARKLLSQGANEYLTKPLELDQLFKVLESHLPAAA